MNSKMWAMAVILALAIAANGATNELTVLLQKGLFEEEANRNLNAAIASYQSLITQFDKDRAVAASAVFRLGECYRKLGRTDDAMVQYERIVRAFSDQETLTVLSWQKLAAVGRQPADLRPPPRANILTAETVRHLEGMRLEAEAQYAKQEKLLATLNSLSRTELKQALPGAVQDNHLNGLFSELNLAEQNFIRLKHDRGPDHVDYKRAKELVADLNRKIEERVDGVLVGLKAQVNSLGAYVESLKTQVEKVKQPRFEAPDKAAR